MEHKTEQTCFVSHIIAFELEVANSRKIEQDTSHRHAMC